MSNTDWIDLDKLADSSTPDEFQWTDGTTYGLDHMPDFGSGRGIQERPDLSIDTVGGQFSIPASMLEAGEASGGVEVGFVQDAAFNLTAMMEEGAVPVPEHIAKAAALADLAWLDPSQEPDPSRLPKELKQGQPPLDSVKELQEAWGVERRTDGLSLIPNRDKSLADYEESLKQKDVSALPQDKVALVKEAAMRALRQAHLMVPQDEIKRQLVATLGKEAALTRKVVASIEAEMGLLGNVYVRASAFPGLSSGRWADLIRKKMGNACYVITDKPHIGQKLGMRAVSEVPWDEAYTRYASKLRAAGHRVASDDPKAALKAAFLSAHAANQEALRTARTESYAGDVFEQKVALSEVEPVQDKQARIAAAELAKAQKALVQAVQSGKLTTAEAKKVANLAQKDANRLRKLTAAAVNAAEQLHRTNMQAAETVEYKGPNLKAHALVASSEVSISPETAKIRKLAQVTGYKPQDITSILKWAKVQLNEGVAGKEMDALLSAKWSSAALSAVEPLLSELRQAHEGLAGQLYVDASVYASEGGTQGCEAGALKHRANPIKHLLAMDRCGGCAKANAEGMCRLYNKKLVASLPHPDPKAYQAEAIRLANASDAEVTGSLFNPAEFSLSNHEMGSIALATETTPTELGEILWK